LFGSDRMVKVDYNISLDIVLMPSALIVVPRHNPSRECLLTSGRRIEVDYVISLVGVLILSALSVALGTLPAERSIVWLQG
jgi:hypothetical protein